MTLDELLQQRHSTRAFRSDPVPTEVLEEVFSLARRTPSNCNTQPCIAHVVSGETRDRLSAELVAVASTGAMPNPDFDWLIRYEGVHRERQIGSAVALFQKMGVERHDKAGRARAFIRNWEFFDAPHAVFFTMSRYLNIMGAVDLGMHAQTLALLLQDRGIGSCFQGALGQFPEPIRSTLQLPDDVGVLFGMSFGYPADAPVNETRTDRAPLEDVVRFWT